MTAGNQTKRSELFGNLFGMLITLRLEVSGSPYDWVPMTESLTESL